MVYNKEEVINNVNKFKDIILSFKGDVKNQNFDEFNSFLNNLSSEESKQMMDVIQDLSIVTQANLNFKKIDKKNVKHDESNFYSSSVTDFLIHHKNFYCLNKLHSAGYQFNRMQKRKIFKDVLTTGGFDNEGLEINMIKTFSTEEKLSGIENIVYSLLETDAVISWKIASKYFNDIFTPNEKIEFSPSLAEGLYAALKSRDVPFDMDVLLFISKDREAVCKKDKDFFVFFEIALEASVFNKDKTFIKDVLVEIEEKDYERYGQIINYCKNKPVLQDVIIALQVEKEKNILNDIVNSVNPKKGNKKRL